MVKNLGAPLKAHHEQGNLYCGAMGLMRILFIYHNRDSGQYLTFLVPFDSGMMANTIAKFRSARQRQATGVLHPRPYNDPTESPCFFCQYKPECYVGFDSQVASGDTRVAEGDLANASAIYLGLRKDRLAMEKAEELVKGRLIDRMIKKKITKLIRDDATLEVRMGKTGKPDVAVKELK